MTEAIEYRFGLIDQVPHPTQWLNDNTPAYIAYETRAFTKEADLRDSVLQPRIKRHGGIVHENL